MRIVSAVLTKVQRNAVPLRLPSLITKFEGGPLDLEAKVGWGGFQLRDAIYLGNGAR